MLPDRTRTLARLLFDKGQMEVCTCRPQVDSLVPVWKKWGERFP